MGRELQSFKKRRPRRKFKGKGGLNLKQKSQVKNMIKEMEDRDVELKAVDTNINNTFDTLNEPVHLTGIAQGANISERIGNQITLKYFTARLQFTVADSFNVFRVIFFRWFDDISPTQSDLLASAGDVTSLSDIIEGKHYQVLLNKNVIVTTEEPTEIMDVYYEFKKTANVHYDNTGINAYSGGSLWYLIYSDSGAVTHPSVLGHVRVRYTDA